MDTRTRMEIEFACRELVHRAAECVDRGDAQGLAALFTEHGVLVRPSGQVHEGREAILAGYSNRAARMTRHLVTNTLVTADSATTARARSYVLLWTGSADDPPGPHGRRAEARQVVGEFLDTFACEAGTWRISRREASFVFHAGTPAG